MLEDGTYRAVLDRVEAGADEELAVLIIERDGEAVDDAVVPLEVLPEEERDPDTVFNLVLEDGEVVSMEPQEAETEQRTESIEDRFARLSRRLSDSDDTTSE